MDRNSSDKLVVHDESKLVDKSQEDRTDLEGISKTHVVRKYYTKHMKMYPELYRSDVSINPSYTGLKNLPYCGASPLELWGIQVKNGYTRRVTDEEVKSLALEIAGTNVATTYIYTPKNPKTVLAINLPFLIMVIKNMKKYFTFEITILDDKHMHRRFRISNFQSTTKVRPFCTSMPIGLPDGWSQIQFNLADFTRRAYGSNYVETTRMQIHANCRIRRVYFADRLYTDDELPEDYKLLFPERYDSREGLLQGKKTGERSQARIPVEAVPADEPPDFQADTEKLEDDTAGQTTPAVSVEPSRTIVAPEGASRVQLEIAVQSEDEEEIEQDETDFESEIEEATTEEPGEIVEETIAEETIAEETIAEETIAEETIAEETIVEETIVEETIVEEQETLPVEEDEEEETNVELYEDEEEEQVVEAQA